MTILKNSFLADGSIVGTGSLVKSQFRLKNAIATGNPAKEIREGVRWQH